MEKFYGMSQRLYLQMLCNKYGDFKVAQTKDDGSWSKHKSVLDIWHDDKEFWRLDRANNRTILPCEIVLDIDWKKNDTPRKIKNRFNKACKLLEQNYIQYIGFFSGSRGYHIHIIIHDDIPKYYRTYLREHFLELLGFDLHKKNETSMIALEFAPHYKTGNLKTPIRGNLTYF